MSMKKALLGACMLIGVFSGNAYAVTCSGGPTGVGETWYANFNSATNSCTIDFFYVSVNGYLVGAVESGTVLGTFHENGNFTLPESLTVNGDVATDIIGGYAFRTLALSGDYIAVLLANIGGRLYRMEFSGTITGSTSRLLSASVSAVPLPAALPLFAAGLSAVGLMGWRRKRKTIAAPLD